MSSIIVNADPQFIFTIFFLSLGPVKIIFPFVKLTHNSTPEYRRNVAIWAAIFATIVVLLVALFGHHLIAKYQLSLDAQRLAGGLILLISALFNTFPHLQPPLDIPKTELTAIQLAIRPIVSPIIIPPIGIAAILIFTTLFQGNWDMQWIIVKSLLTIMIFDLIVFAFNKPTVV